MDQQELIKALFDKKNEVVEAYLKNGGDPNWTDEWGKSLLHSAAMYNNTEAIEILIKAGANIEARDKDGCTPFFWPTKAEPILALHAHGADIHAWNNDGNQPLHFTTTGGHTEAVCTLLALGADMYSCPKGEKLPAPYSAFYSDTQLGVLAAYKSAGFKEDGKHTLVLAAESHKKPELVERLRQIGLSK